MAVNGNVQTVVAIADANADNRLKINSDGSINVTEASSTALTTVVVAAGTATIGNIGTGTASIGSVRFTPAALDALTEVIINANTTALVTLVGSVTLQTVRLHRLLLVVAASCTLTFQDTTGTALTGAIPLSANGSIILDFTGEPWFTTPAGTGFGFKVSSTFQVSGRAYYTQS